MPSALPVPPLPALRDTVLVGEDVTLRVPVALPVGEVEVLAVEEPVVVGDMEVVVDPLKEGVRVFDPEEVEVVVEVGEALVVDVEVPEGVPEEVEVAVPEDVPEEVEVAVSLRDSPGLDRRRRRVKKRERRPIKTNLLYE